MWQPTWTLHPLRAAGGTTQQLPYHAHPVAQFRRHRILVDHGDGIGNAGVSRQDTSRTMAK